jgi:Domain of unknown function (DUF4956)
VAKLPTFSLELIVPARQHELRADLEQRTGWTIRGIEIGDIDFLRDTVQLKVTYVQQKALSPAQYRALAINQTTTTTDKVRVG